MAPATTDDQPGDVGPYAVVSDGVMHAAFVSDSLGPSVTKLQRDP